MKIETCDYQLLNQKTGLLSEGIKLIKSLRDTGFAVIVNHNISKELVTKMYNNSLMMFSNEFYKSAYLHDETSQSGYFPFKSENAKNAQHKDLKEFWHIFGNRFLDCPVETWDATEEYFEKAEEMGLALLDVIEKLTPSMNSVEWSQNTYNSKTTLLRLLYYPPIENALEGEIRAAEHEDINLITLLPFATTAGLEVKDNEGNWHRVETEQDNAIIINVGDMLQELTNGYYKSTTHRVVNPEDATKSRYSMPLFIHPQDDFLLSDRYTAKEYLDERLKEIGLKK